MTNVTSTQAILSDARVTYARDQAQQSSVTGAKINANPTKSDLLANDPTLETALLAAEETSTSSAVSGGAQGSSSGAPAGGAGGLAAVKAPAPSDAPAPAVTKAVDIQA